jgi:hypothetical protein
MSGLNKNFVLSKGKIYFEQFVNGASAGEGEEYFAQTKSGTCNVASETLDHYDADEGLNVLDEQITTKVDVTGKFETENITLAVLAKFFLSDGVSSLAVTSATGTTETFTCKKGRFYQLGKTDSTPSGARNVTITQIALASAPSVALSNTNNAIYTADVALGRIYINPTETAIDEDEDFIVTYNVASGTRDVVVSKDQQIRGALRFISANPVGGQRDFFWPLVNLSPDGDVNLKGGTEWQSLPFKFTALKLGALERLYIDGRAA